MYRTDRYHHENRIARYFRRTWKNKLYAIILLAVTYAAARFTGEAGAFVIMLMLAVPMFFAGSNWFTNR